MTLSQFIQKVNELKIQLMKDLTSQDDLVNMASKYGVNLNNFRGDMIYSEIARKIVCSENK